MNTQTTTKHTLGPWFLDEENSHFKIYGHNYHTRITTLNNEITEDKANARLIAAAPELLACCLSALRALEDNLTPGPMDGDAKEALRIAISKAMEGA